MKMNSRILTKDELEFLKKISEKILKPIEGRVFIDSEPTKIHWHSESSGTNRSEWDEYVYRISIGSKKGEAELRFVFYDTPLVVWAWHIAADAFFRLDDDIDGLVAENLWPSDNGYKPDYKRFLDKN